MSKLPFVPLAFVLTVGVTFSVNAQSQTQGGSSPAAGLMAATPPPASGPAADVLGTADISRLNPKNKDSSNTDDGSSRDTPGSNSSDVDDDTLQRLGTKDSLAPGAMGRDEGQLTRKPHKRERVSEVESTKQLKTSGTDSKFTGSLLNSSIGSIDDLNDKPSAEAANNRPQPVFKSDERFDSKNLTFAPTEDNSAKKDNAKSHTKSATSPSPTATPTPSSNASKR